MLICLQISTLLLKDANAPHPPHCCIPTPVRIAALPGADIGSLEVLGVSSVIYLHKAEIQTSLKGLELGV